MTSPDSFDLACDRLLGHEGGYVFDENDPGGETKWGISKRSYPDLDIKNLTREQAKDIYRRDFWQRGRMAAYDFSVAFQVFDIAVNSGIETAIRMMQRAADVADDGYVGPMTLGAVKATSRTDMLMRLNAERLDYMTRLKNWPHHGKGWARRISQNLRYGAIDT